jgi:hypothetical protein
MQRDRSFTGLPVLFFLEWSHSCQAKLTACVVERGQHHSVAVRASSPTR